MIQVFRNPFAMRASEKITDDVLFLKLFSADSLNRLTEKFNKEKLWGNVIRISSAPGGGKTSLLRIFSPSALKELVLQSSSQDNIKMLYSALRKLEVLSDNRIRKCGVYLLTERDYEFLWQMDEIPLPRRRQIFFALFNARICLATIKTIMILKDLDRNGIEDISFAPPADNFNFMSLELCNPCTGKDLYDWAATQENNICNYLQAETEDIPASNTSLFAFELFKAEHFTYKGESICEDFIFMLDDVHKLGRDLFKYLQEEIVEKRVNVNIFIAHRIDVLPAEDVLMPNNEEDRDFVSIKLEEYSKGNKIYEQISSSRSSLSLYNISLLDSLDNKINISYDSKYQKVVEDCKRHIEKIDGTTMFSEWMEALDNSDVSWEERAISYKALSIYAARDIAKNSHSFFAYPVESMAKCLDSELENLARMLICSQYKIPQYYGSNSLKDLASNNVEQFITFASSLFDVLVGKVINHESHKLTAKEQDDVIHEVCKLEFDKIKYLPRGKQVTNFLTNLIKVCSDCTNTTTASYKNVTGFAISNESKQGEWYKKEEYAELADVIRICLANNLLSVKLVNQGGPGEQWTVLYLNRYLCAYKSIPLPYGYWRKIKLEELTKWLGEK